LRHGEKVLTVNGFINIESIKVGDLIVSPTNSIETVLGVYPQGVVDIYRVTFQDGRTIDCCGEHLWKYHLAGRGNRESKVTNTVHLKEIVDKEQNKSQGERKRLPIIPLCEPLGNQKNDLPIHPYVLGAILGDGSLSQTNTPRITSMDDFIFNKIENLGYSLGSIQSNENNKAWSRSILGIHSHIKELGLGYKKSQDKFIPDVYKNASIEDRFQLVQGLMDTDGYVDDKGVTYFDITSEQMCHDLQEILFSLGFTAKITTKQGRYKKNGVTVECSTVYKMYIRGNLQEKLCSLPRKVERLRKKTVGNRIESIEYVGKDNATCISVSGDRLFITTNYIVTHNTMLCLMKNLDAIHDPHFKCAIFRRSQPELKRQGGIVSESQQIYRDFGGEYKTQAMRWDFPSGAQIAFNAIASDADLGSYQGMQVVRTMVDEAADGWSEHQILFLLSRMRSAKSKIYPQLIMTANPDVNSFLKTWLEKYCLDEDGIPIEGTENIIRWFCVIDSQVLWGDSPENCFELHGKPRGMVYARGMTEDEIKKHPATKLFMPKSFRFIPCGVMQNPYLLPPRNNSYLANLLSQPLVNQKKYLHGSWTAKAEGEGYFKREWVKLVDRPPTDVIRKVRAWDFAASEPSQANRDPDWTASVLMSRDALGNYYIEDMYRFRKSTAGVIEEVIKVAKQDGLDEVEVGIPKDTGSGGSSANYYFTRTFAEHGITIRSVKMSGHSGKLNRFLPFASIAEAGAVYVVKGDWNEDFFNELERFIPNNRNQKDDIVDSCSDAFNLIAKSIQIPTFVIPDYSKPSVVQQLN
jgi:predicted phage terminase large subunit-like protein